MTRKKSRENDEKTEVISIRISHNDKELIDRACKKEGINMTQYVMGCIYMDMLTSGDAEMMQRAISQIGSGIKSMMREAFFGKKSSVEVGELHKA